MDSPVVPFLRKVLQTAIPVRSWMLEEIVADVAIMSLNSSRGILVSAAVFVLSK